MPRIRAENIEAHKELTRRDILDATHEVLAEVGSADISLGEVALHAGIGRTTLYEYFRDKDDLIASLVEERLPEVVEDLIGSVPQGLNVEERLVRLSVATVEFVVNDPVLGLILHREVPRMSHAAQDRIMMAHSDLATEMVNVYLTGVKKELFRRMAPDIAGRFIYDVIMSAAKVLIAAADPAKRFSEVADDMSAFLLGGLAAGQR